MKADRFWTGALAVALFFMLFTSDIKIPMELFEGLPVWLLVTPPLLLLVSARYGSWPEALFWVPVVAILLGGHLLLSRTMLDNPPVTRSLIQIGVIAVVLPLLVSAIHGAPNPMGSLIMAAKTFLWVQLLTMIGMLLIDFTPESQSYHHYFLPIWRESGLFREPSHVAVALSAPLAIMIGFPKLWFERFGWSSTIVLMAIVFLCPSATLVWPVLGGITALCLRRRGVMAIVAPLAVLGFAFIPPFMGTLQYTNPIAQRIYDTYRLLFQDTRSEYMNASALVLAKGVFVMRNSLGEYPMGVGLDNMYYANALFGFGYSHTFGDWNARDATSIGIKAITEFGWFGIVGMVITIVRLALTIGSKHLANAFFPAVALTLLISVIGRGSGYFDSGFLLVPALLIAGWTSTRRLAEQRTTEPVYA